MSTPRLHDNRSLRVDDPMRMVIDAIPALVWLAAPDGGVVHIGQRWLAYTGLTAEQASGWGWLSAIHRDDTDRFSEHWRAALASGEPGELEARLRRFDGEHGWVLFRAEPLRDGSGGLTGWCGTHFDIEDRKRAEELARVNQHQLRAIVDNIPAMVAIHDDLGVVVLQNREAQDFHRRSLDETRQWEKGEVVHPNDVPALLAIQKLALSTGEPQELEMRIMRGDGAYRWVHMRTRRSSDGCDGAYRWYTVGTDIHDRKTAEDKLRRSESFMLEVQRLSRSGGWRWDPATDVVESSTEIQRAHAAQPGEDISQPAFWFDRIHPEDRPGVQALFEASLRDRTEYRAGYRIIVPDGSIRYQYSTGNPVSDDAGKLVEFIGASMEMTEHWLAMTELKRASEAVRDLQLRMSRAAQSATVGELAASIAHEVNQPLAAVVTNGHACLRWLAASPPNLTRAIEAAERVVKDGKDAGEVVRRVRALFKRTAFEKVPLDANEVIREVLRLLDSYPARRHVTIDTTLEPDLPHLLADRVQLQQLVMNLMLNALEALEPVSGRAKRLSVRSGWIEGGSISIEIADNGVGLDDPQAVFEAFFTTKPNGMGLGLAICRSIATAHDGKLTAKSNVGFGTTFTISLPIEPGGSP